MRAVVAVAAWVLIGITLFTVGAAESDTITNPLFVRQRDETVPPWSSANVLDWVRSGRVPMYALALADAPVVLTPGVQQSTRTETPPPRVVVGPHPTLFHSTTRARSGRFMVLVRPRLPASIGRPPLVYVPQTFEGKLIANNVTDIHHLDASHLIAYVPDDLMRRRPTTLHGGGMWATAGDDDEGRELLRADTNDMSSVTVVTAFDVFAARAGGPRLKWSPELRQWMSDSVVEEVSPPAATPDHMASLLRVGVWTVRGDADTVKRELESTPSFRQFLAPVPNSSPGQSHGETTEQLRCRIAMHPGSCLGTCSDHFVLVLSASRSSASSDGSDTTPTARLRVCRRALLLVAAHHSVRWLEPLSNGAEPANVHAVSFIQNNSALDSAVAVGTQRWLFAHPLWAAGINGSGEVVAIVDSGVDVDSCFFYDAHHSGIAYYPQKSKNHRKIISYLRASCEGDPVGDAADSVGGHGTHVAGSAVGYVEGHKTMSAYNGVATGAKLFVHDLGCPQSPKLQLPSNFRDVFTPSYDVGARITCNSWGVEGHPTYSAMERMVDQYLYEHDDMLAIFAAGNAPTLGPTRPGRAKNVLTVGSHNNKVGLSQTYISSFSAHGPTYDQRQKPDVVAPGDPVRSANSDGRADSLQCTVVEKHGTSMSAAIVAGGAALVRQYFREVCGLESPSAALVKAAIIHATHFLSTTPDRSGFGRVDLSLLARTESAATWNSGDAALTSEALLTPRARLWFRDRVPIAHQESHVFCFSAVSTTDTSQDATSSSEGETHRTQPVVNPEMNTATVKVTLVWTDVGTAAEGSNRSLVHDLDLIVVDTQGRLYYSHDRRKAPHREFDRVNNVEQIELPLTGELGRSFRVFVHGASVITQPTQAYSLVVTAPGLVFYRRCAALSEALAAREGHLTATATPTTVQESGVAAVAPLLSCPGNCSGSRGRCNTETGQCECLRVYQFIDCSQCAAAVLCGGRGTCDDTTLKCTCDPHGHFKEASDCRTCEDGWFGPNCNFDCTCEHGGVCDTAHGMCQCPRDERVGGSGCFQGPHCEYCCDGFGGDGCRERSYWCNETGALVVINDNDADGAFIQVNGFARYETSLTCRWRIVAPPQHRVALEVIKMDLEAGYDFLNIYDTLNAAKAGQAYLVQRYTSTQAVPSTVVSSSTLLDLVFVSDWEGTSSGFQLHYRFVPVEVAPACQVDCSRVSDDALLDASAPHRVCGAALGLDSLCLCQAGLMGFNCDYRVNSTLQESQCTTTGSQRRTGGTPTAAAYEQTPNLVPADRHSVAEAHLYVEGSIPTRTSLLGPQPLLLHTLDSSVRLPLGLNAPSTLDLSLTLTGEWTSDSVSLYEQQVSVQLQLQPMSTCDAMFSFLDGYDTSNMDAATTTTETPPFGELFGLSLIAYQQDSGRSAVAKSTQTLSLYQCPMLTNGPTLSIVLRAPDLQEVSAAPRVQLTFTARVSVMLAWNSTSRVPDDFRGLPQVADVAVLPVKAHWLDIGTRGTTPGDETARSTLLPWTCEDDAVRPLRAVPAELQVKPQIVDSVPQTTEKSSSAKAASTSIAQFALTSALGLLSGSLVVLAAYKLRCTNSRPVLVSADQLTEEHCMMDPFASNSSARTKTAIYV